MVIDGIGGVGKSALALELGYRMLGAEPDYPLDFPPFDAAVWISAKRNALNADGIHARSPELVVLRDLFTAIGTTLGRDDMLQLSEPQQQQLAKELLNGPERVLLVVDNLETVDDEHVRTFLQDIPQPSKAIVTTRHKIDVAFSFRLEGLPHEEAVDLIGDLTSDGMVQLSTPEASELIRKTGGVPLAIVWSIGLIRLGHPVESVLRRRGSGHGDIAEFCFAESVYSIDDSHALTLLLTLAMFDLPVSRDQLGLAAGLGEDIVGRDDGLQSLQQLSLVNVAAGRLTLLPLTRTFARRLLEERPAGESSIRSSWIRALLAFADDYKHPDPEWRDLRRLRLNGAHLETAYEWAKVSNKSTHMLSLAPGLLAYLDCVGRWDDLVQFAPEVASLSRSLGMTQLTLDCGWYLSWLYGQRGELANAEAALSSVESLVSDVDSRVHYLVCMSQVRRRAGRFAEAHELVQEALSIVAQCTSPTPDIARANVTMERAKLSRDCCSASEFAAEIGPRNEPSLGVFSLRCEGVSDEYDRQAFTEEVVAGNEVGDLLADHLWGGVAVRSGAQVAGRCVHDHHHPKDGERSRVSCVVAGTGAAWERTELGTRQRTRRDWSADRSDQSPSDRAGHRPGKISLGLAGPVPVRVPADVKELVLKTVDDAVGAGFSHRWATSVWQVSDDRVHRWRTRRQHVGTLDDLAPGGTALHALMPDEIDAILSLTEQWGPTDGSHRKLAHRGSYIGLVWVSPSTFRRVLAAHSLILPERPPTPRRPKTPWPEWLVWEPNRIWIWDVTHFTRAKRCVFAIVDMVSRMWIATLVSPEETSTQVRVVFDAALVDQGLDELLTDERLDLPASDTSRPILLAVSDNGPAMTSTATKAYMVLMAIAQHHGRPHTPTDQAWIETFFGHIKHEWPHLLDIDDPSLLESELERVKIEYNTVRLSLGDRDLSRHVA